MENSKTNCFLGAERLGRKSETNMADLQLVGGTNRRLFCGEDHRGRCNQYSRKVKTFKINF